MVRGLGRDGRRLGCSGDALRVAPVGGRFPGRRPPRTPPAPSPPRPPSASSARPRRRFAILGRDSRLRDSRLRDSRPPPRSASRPPACSPPPRRFHPARRPAPAGSNVPLARRFAPPPDWRRREPEEARACRATPGLLSWDSFPPCPSRGQPLLDRLASACIPGASRPGPHVRWHVRRRRRHPLLHRAPEVIQRLRGHGRGESRRRPHGREPSPVAV